MPKAPFEGVRRSRIAGAWYPGSREALARTVDNYLQGAASQPLPGETVALVAPHAGYIYSGQVAAYAYRQVQGREFETVVVVGPSHQLDLRRYGVTAVRSYETPLGQVALDVDLLTALAEAAGPVEFLPEDGEHSLEIQLPFLQRAVGSFRLAPVMMGDQSLAACQELGQTLGRLLAGRSALLVASSDLSHYHTYQRANTLDHRVAERLEAFDALGLANVLVQGKAEACGGGPIIAVMLAAQALGADAAQVLRYANSGDVTGDHAHVVGYLAAALYRRGSAA
ncbi:MAG: AmmeMemoRadiSam system protein B [Chloroflexi bacterium]|nr:AmmeMemoRadiSam system protein B [Chloroflexota bacterium]